MLPKHTRGPALNTDHWKGDTRKSEPSVFDIQRSGLNSFASAPQIFVKRP